MCPARCGAWQSLPDSAAPWRATWPAGPQESSARPQAARAHRTSEKGQGQRLERRPGMRILVDQSGYALLTLGDIAMLQSCVIRLGQLCPDAEIMVISHAPEPLA